MAMPRWLLTILLSQRLAECQPDSDLFPDYTVDPPSAPVRSLRPARRERVLSRPTVSPDEPIEEEIIKLVPVNAAGFKCEDSALVEAAGAKCSLLAKSIGPLGCQRVLADLAAERGKSLEGVPQAFRQRRVADACPQSCGLCDSCAPGCAKWFIGNGWCEPDCNNKACQWDGGDCWEKDCAVGPWSELSECTIPCDPRAPTGSGGTQVRTRSVKVKPSQGGKACPPLEEKVYGCNANVPCPVECEVSPWGPWTPCSVDCGPGQSVRARTVVRTPAHGALRCPELKQSRPCFLSECPMACDVSEWSDWSPCSSSCDGGNQFRSRTIVNHPVGPGSTCPPLFEERLCNEEPCTTETCALSSWSEWTPCSHTCGGGTQTRYRRALDSSCVTSAELEDTRECNVFSCVADCVLSDWSDWSQCDALCGEGVQTRTRDVLETPTLEGKACGSTLQSRKCYERPCSDDCEVSDWTEWSGCTVTASCGTGTRVRSRSAITIPANGGDQCPHLVEFEDCHQPCDPPTCLVSTSAKSAWSVCEHSCHIASGDDLNPLHLTPVQWRHPISEYDTGSCSPSDEEMRNCDGGICELELEDCLVSEWTSWTPCSQTCGGGTHSRSRTVLREGNRCPPLYESETCGVAPCPTNCVVGDWSNWSTCAAQCGMGTQHRSRPILVPASSHPFAEVCGPVTQVAPCVAKGGACPRECVVSEWSPWSACSESCGGGIRRRQRSITQHPINSLCPDLEQSESCNEFPCPVDCIMSDWTPWTECSASCLSEADGTQTRTRSIVRHSSAGGILCPPDLVETRTCRGSDSCTEVDCPMGPWSPCHSACGEDVIYRDPIPMIEGMSVSLCRQQRQTATCFTRPCPVDCQVTDWTEWDACSADCGGGDQKRVREIIVPASNGGSVCPHLWDDRRCNEKPCSDVESLNDCLVSTWSPWSPCSRPCGGGITMRSRTVERPAAPGGKACASLTDRKGCNLQRCAGTPCEDNPRLAENGITCNILKTQGCTTGLWDLAKSHGVELPPDVPPEARVQDACPNTCDVCTECAPGCEIRDLGNTVCTPECDNEACDFDRGDCGGDCLLPDGLSGGELVVQPSVTALQDGQQVEVRCSGARRFSTRPALDFVTVMCGSIEDQPLALHLLPTPGSSLEDTNEDIAQITCDVDPCPFVYVTGFKSDLSLFNGIYPRNVEAPAHTQSMFRRRAGKRFLTFAAEESSVSSSKWRFVEPADQAVVQLLPDIISNECVSPTVIGGDLEPSCSDEWIVDAGGHATFSLDEKLTLRCLSAEEKLSMKSKGTGPSTRIPTGRDSFMPARCEDIKMVEQLSGYTCSQLERAVGCHFLLSETGHKLPPFLPADATVAFVCPETCDQCVECDRGCAVWFLGNGYCDPACDNEACNFDEGDCSNDPDYHQAEDRLLEPQPEPDCEDDPIVVEMGFTCQLLKLGASLPGFPGCEMTLKDLARSQGLEIKLPDEVPESARILDACPVTCECCSCERLKRSELSATTDLLEISSTHGDSEGGSTAVSHCSDSDLVEDQSGFTCGEIVHLLRRCDLTLGELGYLPEGMPDTITLEQLCPFSCGICSNPRLKAYECHDFPALQKMSGFGCEQAVALLTPSVCNKVLSTFGYELPAAIPANATLSAVCGETCGLCEEEEVTSMEISAACEDSEFIYDLTGFECAALVDIQGDCTLPLESLGYVLPDNIPANATLGQACPRSCNTCPPPATGVCEDSPVVTTDLRQTCSSLVSVDGCATLISASSLIKNVPTSLGSEMRIGDLCRSSCGYCGDTSSNSICRDHPAVEQAGYSCPLFLQFASDGCKTPLLRLLGRGASLPPGVPASTTIQDACPKTCNVCSDDRNLQSTQTVCEDSPVLNAVSLSCAQVIGMAGGGGKGCVQTVVSIAGNTPITAMLPDGMRIMDLCQRSCHLCGQSSCDDGFLNGNETSIDCGGESCRPCRPCSSSALKQFSEGIVTIPLEHFGDDFSDGAQRIVGCLDAYQSSSTSVETITCSDGSWSTPKTKCELRTITLWRGTIGLTHGAEFDFNIIKPILSAWTTIIQLIEPSFDTSNLRIASAGSCAAMTVVSSTDCEDNPLVEGMGFGCSMLAGLGCSQSLAALAAIQGTPLPAGIPDDALVADACPVTCDACEEAAARMAEYMATVGDQSDPLGSDCFKADLLILSDEDIPVKLQSSLGNVATVTKLLSAAFRDTLVESNVTIFTNYTATAKTQQSALSFVAARPVEIMVQGPITESSGFEMSTSSATPSTLFLPLEQVNVTLLSWETALQPSSLVSKARAIFKSNGVKPGLQFSVPIAQLQSALYPPVRSDIASKDLTGYYYGDAPLGSVLGRKVQMIRHCEESCCDFKDALQSFMDGPCGSLLISSQPSEQDLSNFCRIPESEKGVTSCLAKGLSLLHEYRDRGEPGCQAAEYALTFLTAVCAQDVTTGKHCLLSMQSDLTSLSYDALTLKSSGELDVICDRDSCVRSHFKYLDAIATLSVALSLDTHDGTDIRQLRQDENDVNIKLRAQFAKLQPQRKLAVSVQQNLLHQLADNMNSWTHIHSDLSNPFSSQILGETARHRVTARRRLSSDDTSTPFVVPLDKLGADLLSIVCVKVNDDYCQQTLQLLAEDNPIANPQIVESPCASECFRSITGRMGEVLLDQGRNFKAPQQLALGSLMTHYSRFACLTNSQNVQCRNAISSSPHNLQSMFNSSIASFSASSECTVASFVGDGQCDRECFNPECGFDESDCLLWSMYPESTARLLSTLCLESLDDRCNPLQVTFDCSVCKGRISACLENHGCCYSGALETLRATLQAQKEIMIYVAELSGTNTIKTFYDAFDLERVPAWYEKNCTTLSFDRSCVFDQAYNQHRIVIEISNLNEPSYRRRRLQPETQQLQGETRKLQARQMETLTSYIQEPSVVSSLASFFHLVPSDMGRVLVRPMRDERSLVEIDIDTGKYHENEIWNDTPLLPTYVLSLLSDCPAFWNGIVNKTEMPEARIESVQSALTYSNSTSSTYEGAWGMTTYGYQLVQPGCPSSAIWSLAAKGMILTKSPEVAKDSTVIPHGTAVTVACLSGHIASSAEHSSMKCDNGIWIFQNSFVCHVPCTTDPIEALGLETHAVYVQPVNDNPLTQLFAPKLLQKQTILTPGTKYPAGSSVLLSCVDTHTTNIASDWGVTVTQCSQGHWTKAGLDCQPPCPSTPPFVQDLPQAYSISNALETRYGGMRGLECESDYFAIPPSFEGASATIECVEGGIWSEPPFRCVAGLTIDPTGGLNTVQKMLRTLFSTTGILSLAIFFTSMIVIIIFIAFFWKLFYRTKADKAYAEQRRLLREYLASTVTGASATDDGYFGKDDEWQNRSPSSSTVSAVRRVVLLAGTSVMNHPSQ